MGLLTSGRFAFQRIFGRSGTCAHLRYIKNVDVSGDVCPQCVELGDEWVHLRICMTCGAIGCCDSSRNKHAHKHADGSGHPIAASLEPGEDWMWCYVDETVVEPGT